MAIVRRPAADETIEKLEKYLVQLGAVAFAWNRLQLAFRDLFHVATGLDR